MAAHALPDEILIAAIRLVEQCLKEGFAPPWMASNNGAIAEACRRSVANGFTNSRAAFDTRYRKGIAKFGEPDWSLFRAPTYQMPPHEEPELESHQPGSSVKLTGKKYKVCAIGDAHDDPRLTDKSRFKWMGRWAQDCAPDYIVQIGDWGTIDSLSTHAQKGTLKHRAHPSWSQDLGSLDASQRAFEDALRAGKEDVTRIFTKGNHEQRADRYEDANPDMRGTLVSALDATFEDKGWRVVPFGEYAYIDGVGFIHHPINAAGKAYGGKTGNQRAANDTVFSIVHGHDHRLERVSSPKIGHARPVEVLSIGCTLPWGWVEPYAKVSTEGWWWGVVEMTIQNGVIIDMAETSMLTLEERYADKKLIRPKAKAKTF